MGVLAALKSQFGLKAQAGSTVLKSIEAMEDCFEVEHPIDVLGEISPILGAFVNITGLAPVAKAATCSHYYLGTIHKDKNFTDDDIDDLLEYCGVGD